MLSAHLDHLGVNEAAAAGTTQSSMAPTTMRQVALRCLSWPRLSLRKRPKRRSISCALGEERGGFGAQYLSPFLPVPLEQIVADVTFEMLGRPDAKVAANTLWLAGYVTFNAWPLSWLNKRGACCRSASRTNFFQRTDNYTGTSWSCSSHGFKFRVAHGLSPGE
jgi:hypothetical protein